MKVLITLMVALFQLVVSSPLIFAQIEVQNKVSSPVVIEPTEFYITKRGMEFHRKDCLTINDFEIREIGQEEALEKGMKPCSLCMKNRIPDEEISKQQTNSEAKLKYLK